MRTLSTEALRSAHAENTDEVWLVLLTITHADLDEPLRFVNNMESVTSRGRVYVAFPFEIVLPTEDPEEIGEAQLTIDNIDRRIVTTVRDLSSPPRVTLEIVLASSPGTVEASFSGLVLRDVDYDATRVTGTLRYEDIMTEPVSVEMTPSRFPAMF